MPLLLAAAWWSPRATGRLPISSDSPWSRVAFQADVIDEGLEGASRICRQPGEPVPLGNGIRVLNCRFSALFTRHGGTRG